MQVQSLGWEDPLEEGLATHACVLAWRIPWTEEPGDLQSMRLQRVGHNWSDLACIHAIFHWCSYHILLIHSSINGHLCWEAWFLIQMLLKNYWKIKATQWQKKKKKKIKTLNDIDNLSKISKIDRSWWEETWTVACQVPLSMRFSTQEYWSGLPCPPQINWLPKGNLERWGDNKVSGPETFPAGFFFNLSRLEYSDIVKLLQMIEKDNDFPGGPVVKTPCCTAGDEGLIPSWGTKIPHSTGAWPKKGKRESLMVHFVEKS